MQDENSVYANPAIDKKDTVETIHGKQTTYATHPVSSNNNSTNIDRRDVGLKCFWLFLKFIEQQLTSQLPLLFFGTLVFILVTMIIGQSSEGIKFKLDLEVSPPSNQVDRNFKDNK